jgi:hypothetical protein
MRDPAIFQTYTGMPKHYKDYLKFFSREVSEKGVAVTLNEYLFKNDERANDMIARLYDGKVSPVLELFCSLNYK